MASVAGIEIHREGTFPVMTDTAGFALAHGLHGYFARAKLHFKQAVMASVAAELDAVDPVGKLGGRHDFGACFLRFARQNQVAGRCKRLRGSTPREQQNCLHKAQHEDS